MQNAYIALLLTATLFGIYRISEAYNGPLFACLAIVAANWVVNTSYVLATGETDATACFLATDVLSLVLVHKASGRLAVGQMLASSYAGQILAHLLHWNGAFDDYAYWELLTLIGYGQLVILAVWAAIPSRDAGYGLE